MAIRWPLRQQMIPGERLSSWLRRTGNIYGMKADELLQSGLGFSGLKANQLDLKISGELVAALSERTGLPSESIKRATYSGALPFLYSDSEEGSYDNYSVLWQKQNFRQSPLSEWLPWFKSRFHGCRLCLSDFPNSKIMLSWGLNIVKSCAEHGVQNEPGRLSQKSVQWLQEKPVPVPSVLATLDKRSADAINDGFVRLPGGVVDACQWFRLMQTVFQELNTIQLFGSKRFEWQEMIWEAAGYCPSPSRPFGFDISCAMLVAIAMNEIEEKVVCPEGKQAYLFLPGSRQRTRTHSSAYEKSQVEGR